MITNEVKNKIKEIIIEDDIIVVKEKLIIINNFIGVAYLNLFLLISKIEKSNWSILDKKERKSLLDDFLISLLSKKHGEEKVNNYLKINNKIDNF